MGPRWAFINLAMLQYEKKQSNTRSRRSPDTFDHERIMSIGRFQC